MLLDIDAFRRLKERIENHRGVGRWAVPFQPEVRIDLAHGERKAVVLLSFVGRDTVYSAEHQVGSWDCFDRLEDRLRALVERIVPEAKPFKDE